MSLFLDYLWIWVVLTFAAGVCGYTWYLHDQRVRSLAVAVIVPILILSLGLALYYGVDTDRKSITRMLDALVAAVERGDPEAVCRFIAPKAEEIQKFARNNMRLVDITRARYHNVQIVVNDATSPPSADVRFSAIFYWKIKEPIGGFSVEQPVFERVRFEIELVKTKDPSWLITKCRPFSLRNY